MGEVDVNSLGIDWPLVLFYSDAAGRAKDIVVVDAPAYAFPVAVIDEEWVADGVEYFAVKAIGEVVALGSEVEVNTEADFGPRGA